jgi:hypothetical protein
MPPRSPTPLSNCAPVSRPAPWRVIGILHGYRQLASKEGRLCCRNRGRAWRSRSAAARRRCGTALRLAARGPGALAVIPFGPAAGARPLRWPRSCAPPSGHAWPWPPPARGCCDTARARSWRRGRLRVGNASVRGMPVDRPAAPRRKARCAGGREHAGGRQARLSPAHHAGLVACPRAGRTRKAELNPGLTDDEPPQRCLAAAIWIHAKPRQFPVAIFGVIGENSTRCVSRRAARQIDHKVRVLRHQLIVRARWDGSITLTESSAAGRGNMLAPGAG